LIFGIIAIVLANSAKAAIKKNPGVYEGEGLATAGMVLGIVALVLNAIWALIWVSAHAARF
jgi:hypothetical protein